MTEAQRPSTIVVAEDNPAIGQILRFMLEKAGYQVNLAVNGRLAWEMLQAQDVDLLVTDHQMPEMCGVELCEHVRADKRLEHLPIVMLTAKRLELDSDQVCERFGVTRVFPKPFSPKAVTQEISALLSATPPVGAPT